MTKESAASRIGGFRPDEDDPAPLYLQLASLIRGLIRDGDLDLGQALPSERRIMQQTNLSRVTIRKAIDQLVSEGLLQQRRGSGTYVADGLPRIEQPLERLSSFTEDMLNRGHVPTVKWLDKVRTRPTSEQVMLFGLSPGDEVIRLHRLRMGDGIPLAVELATVPAKYLPDPALVRDSLYDALNRLGRLPVRATQRHKARALPAREAQLLGASAGEPALYIERMSRLADGHLVEHVLSWYRSDTYDFVAELNIEPKP
ncbi:MAG: GntR family transcriptional regulator [Hyphomicrobiaceae bacterium]|nr:GntR family transcriptional regulator [Hyphomicrobiaceae bacterium]MCC0025327.1 GntR family transcriptional regulator [Hyphomicrobiaceae bacterium]